MRFADGSGTDRDAPDSGLPSLRDADQRPRDRPALTGGGPRPPLAARRALSVLLVLLTGACVAMLRVDGGTFGSWPAPGLAVAALVLAPSRERWAAAAGLVVVTTLTLGVAVGIPWISAPLVGLGLVVPALVGTRLLARTGRIPMGTPQAENRFGTVLLLNAAAVGVLLTLASLPTLSFADSWPLGVSAAFLVLSSWQVVLPAMFTRGSRLAFAGPRERVVVLVCVAVIVLAAFVPGFGILLFFTFPALGWVALRLSRSDVIVVVTAVSVVVYAMTLAGIGPLTGPLPNMPDALGPAVVFAFVSACAFVSVPISNIVERYKSSIHDERRAAATIERFLGSATRTLILTVDVDGVITSFNRGGEVMLGYRAEDVVGRPSSMLCSSEEVRRQSGELGVVADFDRVVEAQVSQRASREWRLQARDGRQVVVQLAINPVLDPVTQDLSGFFTIGNDVTERARANEVLRQALDREQRSVERLVEADRVKQELVSTVSHELRTPITSIQGYTEMLTDGLLGDLDDEQVDAVHRVRRNAERLRNLVEDLLTLSRAEAGEVQLELVELDLAELAHDAVELLAAISREREVEVILDAPPGHHVVGDAHALERVVVNLLGNALKFTPRGGRVHVVVGELEGSRPDLQPELHLDLPPSLVGELDDAGADGLADHEPAVFLSVSDTGIGIGEEDQRRLFSRFFRATSARDNAVPGTGLGLSIVEAVVTAHGGRVEVDSRLGEGTTMTVVLPHPDGQERRRLRST